jgi:hypothetical protein
MLRLQAFAASENLTFGIIINGSDGNSDPLYAIDAYAKTGLIADTFPVVGSHARSTDRPELGGVVHRPRHHAVESCRKIGRSRIPICCGTCCAACAEPAASRHRERPSCRR